MIYAILPIASKIRANEYIDGSDSYSVSSSVSDTRSDLNVANGPFPYKNNSIQTVSIYPNQHSLIVGRDITAPQYFKYKMYLRWGNVICEYMFLTFSPIHLQYPNSRQNASIQLFPISVKISDCNGTICHGVFLFIESIRHLLINYFSSCNGNIISYEQFRQQLIASYRDWMDPAYRRSPSIDEMYLHDKIAKADPRTVSDDISDLVRAIGNRSQMMKVIDESYNFLNQLGPVITYMNPMTKLILSNGILQNIYCLIPFMDMSSIKARMNYSFDEQIAKILHFPVEHGFYNDVGFVGYYNDLACAVEDNVVYHTSTRDIRHKKRTYKEGPKIAGSSVFGPYNFNRDIDRGLNVTSLDETYLWNDNDLDELLVEKYLSDDIIIQMFNRNRLHDQTYVDITLMHLMSPCLVNANIADFFIAELTR